jgi:predicted acetyltransferase
MSNTIDPGASPCPLSDGAIELRLIRVLGPHNVEARPVAQRFLSHALEYRFAIHRLKDGLRVGRIHLRMTSDAAIVDVLGHAGYAVDEPHRRNGYATRAVRLIVDLARANGVTPLWVHIEPQNTASRRTVERVGFQLVDVINTSPQAAACGVGPKVCRYVLE